MLNYLYKIERQKTIKKSSVYEGFFKAPFVKMYCDQNGIDIATEEGAKHRCPFLLNLLESIGVLSQTRSEIILSKFLVCKQTMQIYSKESEGNISDRIHRVGKILSAKSSDKLDSEEESLLKENFGKLFLSDKFYLSDFEILNNSGDKNVK